MNIRKPIDYSAMFTALDTLIAANLPQIELCWEIGKLVSARPEKGVAVAAAEYLCGMYPDASGFSPRNLRRMREFFRTYENSSEVLTDAMTIGWTQNTVILEAGLTLPEQAWYIRAVHRLGWSKLESGSFQWARNGEEARQFTPQQYRRLMEGLSVEQPKADKTMSGLNIV